jgi:dolichyl-phosphate-mannose--protein O-mannosyl transferase
MIVYSIKTIYDSVKNKKAVIISTLVYGLIAIGLFVLFYPTLSGQPISLEFAEKYLKWFQSWVLVA